MKLSELLMFGTGLLMLGTSRAASTPLNNNASQPYPVIADFVGKNGAEMLKIVMAHKGSKDIDPNAVHLFNDDGAFNSSRLWDAWKEYRSEWIWFALKNSTNQVTLDQVTLPRELNHALGGPSEKVEIPPEDLRAVAVTTFIALQQLSGQYLELANGKLPNFEFRFGPVFAQSYIEDSGGLNVRLRSHKYGTMAVKLPQNYDLESVLSIFHHELHHAVANKKADARISGETTLIEPYTEFLSSLWTANTTDNLPYEVQAHGQYLFTAIARALSDPTRNTGNLTDLQLLPSDYPPIASDGSSPPIQPGEYSVGIDNLREAYFGDNKEVMQKVMHLLTQVGPAPEPMNWNVIIKSVLGAAILGYAALEGLHWRELLRDRQSAKRITERLKGIEDTVKDIGQKQSVKSINGSGTESETDEQINSSRETRWKKVAQAPIDKQHRDAMRLNKALKEIDEIERSYASLLDEVVTEMKKTGSDPWRKIRDLRKQTREMIREIPGLTEAVKAKLDQHDSGYDTAAAMKHYKKEGYQLLALGSDEAKTINKSIVLENAGGTTFVLLPGPEKRIAFGPSSYFTHESDRTASYNHLAHVEKMMQICSKYEVQGYQLLHLGLPGAKTIENAVQVSEEGGNAFVELPGTVKRMAFGPSSYFTKAQNGMLSYHHGERQVGEEHATQHDRAMRSAKSALHRERK